MSTRGVRRGLLLAVLALLTGCVGMPTEGPVEESQLDPNAYAAPGSSYDPLPPQAGQSPTEVVSGFLEAMKAAPISISVARQFLTTAAQEAWEPDRIRTYADLGTPSGRSSVSVELSGVDYYDERGAWERSREDSRLDFVLTTEDGEWRIARAPDALVVPDSWFGDWYQRVSLYYFDPTGQILVPEPVFVPVGDQFTSSMVRGLLTPSSGSDEGVVRTFFPADAEDGLSVPVSTAGIAQVALRGDPDSVDEESAQRMRVQLVWTLRQEPRVRAVELSMDGRAVGPPGGPTQVNLDVGAAYDPTVEGATTDLFALEDGRLVRGPLGALGETFGPLGQADAGVESFGVDLSGTTVAAVTGGGSSLLLAPVDQPDGEVVEVLGERVDLGSPAWDHAGRVWAVDRAGGRARVFMVADGEPREVSVPGVTGRDVDELLVSRDGSRLVAVLRGATQQVVAARVRYDSDGRLLGALPARTLALAEDGSRIRDVGWRTPTAVSVLSAAAGDLVSEVRTISADGAPGEIATEGSTRVRGRPRFLVSSPVEGAGVYAVTRREITDLTTPELELEDLPRGLQRLSYAG